MDYKKQNKFNIVKEVKMTNKEMFKGVSYRSLEEQVGGKHYRR